MTKFIVSTPGCEREIIADSFNVDGFGNLNLVTGDETVAVFSPGAWTGCVKNAPPTENDRIYHNRPAAEFAKAVQGAVESVGSI